MATPISPKRVRYIKLGRKGTWEKDCINNGKILFGFDTGSTQRFAYCESARWDKLAKSIEKRGKSPGTATNITNQAKAFFQDDGSTLWLTFYAEKLYWGFTSTDPIQRHTDGHSVLKSMQDGWKCHDLNEEELRINRLSGKLTKLRSFRGTSCEVENDNKDYAIRRINGHRSPEVENANDCLVQLQQSVVHLLKLLGPKDLELLVDLVFATSGWQRLGSVGKVQKTLDIDLMLPIVDQRAFVQVKARTTQSELDEYIAQLDDLRYDWMFYVYHSGNAETDDKRVRVIGPEELAELVVRSGLIDWLIQKAS